MADMRRSLQMIQEKLTSSEAEREAMSKQLTTAVSEKGRRRNVSF